MIYSSLQRTDAEKETSFNVNLNVNYIYIYINSLPLLNTTVKNFLLDYFEIFVKCYKYKNCSIMFGSLLLIPTLEVIHVNSNLLLAMCTLSLVPTVFPPTVSSMPANFQFNNISQNVN